MTKEKTASVLRWLTAVSILVIAVGLIVSCVAIYQSGPRPFDRGSIAQYSAKLALPGYLCLALILTGLFLPYGYSSSPAIRDDRARLKRYSPRLPEAAVIAKKRKTINVAFVVLSTVCWIYPVVYFCNSSHFTVENLTEDVIRSVLIALIPTVVTLSLCYVGSVLNSRSISREIGLYKMAGQMPGKAKSAQNTSSKRLGIVRCTLLVIAATLILLGISNGGAEGVLGKAIRICTECIGLG